MKISGGFSCIHVRNDEKMWEAIRWPESSRPSAFSISSIHRTAGATDSMVFNARWKASSGEPYMPEKTKFMSRRNIGMFHSDEIVLTARDLPQPEIPIIRRPFGTGTPASTASRVNMC